MVTSIFQAVFKLLILQTTKKVLKIVRKPWALDKTKMELPLSMVSTLAFWYLYLPD